MNSAKARQNIDFGSGPVWKCIFAQAFPLIIAQFVQLLYNVVDRIYIGHMDGGNSIALTGVGLCFPVITLIVAFTALCGNGGVPLFSIARGEGDNERAAKILGNSYCLLLSIALALTTLCYIFRRPILFTFGASEASIVYALEYLDIYLAGTIFAMTSTGLNGYINAQGFPRIGMLSVVIGAVANIILDPVFIFVFDMGVRGAALATIISQALSALWVLSFLTGKRANIRLTAKNIRFHKGITGRILKLGTANFIAQGTNFVVQAACNATLQKYGGDIFIGIMTVTNSVREVFSLPVSGISSGAQPVIGFNYGAKKYSRVTSGINFTTLFAAVYTMLAWILMLLFPRFWFGIFSSDAQLIESGISALRIYFFGFVFMALQFSGQCTFQALGDAKHAIFFSILRKIVIVVPLTLLLPALGFGVKGVFMAEPVSNIIGGLACFITMRCTVYRRLKKESVNV